MTTFVDGRDARWETHRAARRRELVESTLWAIRKHGPHVGMDEIAAQAGTSKPVIYRHFGDRTGLYLAVVEWVTAFITGKLQPALTSEDDLAGVIRKLAESYLELVERDPDIYRFIANRPQLPQGEDPMNGLSERIGRQISDVIAQRLTAQGLDPTPADTWGHGAVGFVRGTANAWLNSPSRRPRAEIAAEVADLFGRAFPTPPHPH